MHANNDDTTTLPNCDGGAFASRREMRYRLVEDFRDFRTQGGLTLPHTYTVRNIAMKFRSSDWFGTKDRDGFIHRSWKD